MAQRKAKQKSLLEVILGTRRTVAPKQQVIQDRKRKLKTDVSGRKRKHKERD